MVRIVLAALGGAVMLFLWAFVSWVFIPWHEIEPMPNEEGVIRAVTNRAAVTGVYWFPWTRDTTMTEEQQAAQVARHRQGPVGMLVLRAEGREPMPVSMHLWGFGLYFVTALAAATLLAMAASALGGYLKRVLFVVLIGVFVAAGSTMISGNYMLYPMDFSLHMAADNIVAALLLGLVLGAIIKQPSYRASAVGA